MSSPFVAEIRIWACNFAPTGWAMCNGQLLPISQNTALFSLIGTFYGGDGKSNFTLLDSEQPSHSHLLNADTGFGSTPDPSASLYMAGQWSAPPNAGAVASYTAQAPNTQLDFNAIGVA